MSAFRFIPLLAVSLFLAGCESLLHDPLLAAYESGHISREEYEQRKLEADETLARSAPAHSELQYTIARNRARLGQD